MNILCNLIRAEQEVMYTFWKVGNAYFVHTSVCERQLMSLVNRRVEVEKRKQTNAIMYYCSKKMILTYIADV